MELPPEHSFCTEDQLLLRVMDYRRVAEGDDAVRKRLVLLYCALLEPGMSKPGVLTGFGAQKS